MHYTLYVFILSIYVSSVSLAMEVNDNLKDSKSETEEINSLGSQGITELYQKLHILQKDRTQQQTTTRTQMQEMRQTLETLKSKNEELSKKINDKTSTAYIEQKVERTIKIYSHPKMVKFLNGESETFFNRNNLFLMLGLTSISFIVGYMIGNKSLLLNHLLWGKKI